MKPQVMTTKTQLRERLAHLSTSSGSDMGRGMIIDGIGCGHSQLPGHVTAKGGAQPLRQMYADRASVLKWGLNRLQGNSGWTLILARLDQVFVSTVEGWTSIKNSQFFFLSLGSPTMSL